MPKCQNAKMPTCQLKIFISLTFLGMDEEREELIKKFSLN
ncbi:MAG: DUF4062 domain-containing protein [Epsilonproteobacteria bacterium]|nr:DUF4062 domain-containing protein [Campylobacterota bacterium]